MTATARPRLRPTRDISRCNGVGAAGVLSSSSAIRPVWVPGPRRDDHCTPGPAHHVGPREHHAGPVAEHRLLRERLRVLVHRGALAGERRLRDREGGARGEARVGGDPIALGEQQHVAHHHVAGRDLAWGSPPRTTVADAALIRARAATAPSARRSWASPSTALATTIAAMTTASTGTPCVPSATQTTRDTATATSSRITRGSASAPRNRRHSGVVASGESSLGPSRASRVAASSAVRPSGLPGAHRRTTSAAVESPGPCGPRHYAHPPILPARQQHRARSTSLTRVRPS